MRLKVCLALCVFLTPCFCMGRTWTDKNARTVEAEVVRVNADRTVVLKVSTGQTVTAAFDTFSAEDVVYLEGLAVGECHEELHSVSWQRLNEVFGASIWQDTSLWDDPTTNVAKRIRLYKESKTDFMENFRAYPLGRQALLGQPVYTVALYGGESCAESLFMVFLNLGDLPPETNPKEVEKAIGIVGQSICDLLEAELGKPERSSLGQGYLREKVWRWDWNGHAILLSLQDGKYSALRIMKSKRADLGGRTGRLGDKELAERLASCVERRENGDVVVTNIPMIDQGPKGYCSPATWERYLRYLDIPADMYLLALAANTGVGGGTYSQDMIAATSNIIRTYGCKLSKAGSKPTVREVAKYIDRGMPIMWSFMSTPEFQKAANENTAKRNGKTLAASGQAEDSSSGGHICLIVGYNAKTDEIAISDSWGSNFFERWVSADRMGKLTLGDMNVIRW